MGDISDWLPGRVEKITDDGSWERRVSFEHEFTVTAVLDEDAIKHLIAAHDNGDIVMLPSQAAHGISISKKFHAWN